MLKVKYLLFVLPIILFMCEAKVAACSGRGSFMQSVYPVDKSQSVPLNTRVVFIHRAAFREEMPDFKSSDVRIVEKDGTQITFSMAQRSKGEKREIYVIQPKIPLKKDTTYIVQSKARCEHGNSASKCNPSKYLTVSTFTTSGKVDVTPPFFNGIEQATSSCPYNHENSCGIYSSTSIFIGLGKSTDESGAKNVLYNLYKADDLSKPIWMFSKYFRGEKIFSGEKDLHDPEGWIELVNSGEKYIMRAIDLAGNEELNTNSVLLKLECSKSKETIKKSSNKPSNKKESVNKGMSCSLSQGSHLKGELFSNLFICFAVILFFKGRARKKS